MSHAADDKMSSAPIREFNPESLESVYAPPDPLVDVCREVDRETSGQKQLHPTEAEQLLELGDPAEVVPVFIDKWRRYKSAAFYKLLRYTREALERDRQQAKPRNALKRDNDTLGQEILEEMLANATSSGDEVAE